MFGRTQNLLSIGCLLTSTYIKIGILFLAFVVLTINQTVKVYSIESVVIIQISNISNVKLQRQTTSKEGEVN